ncbi:MAG TPA: hypothetical protein VII46_00375 [Acidimicrobiales bacterium]
MADDLDTGHPPEADPDPDPDPEVWVPSAPASGPPVEPTVLVFRDIGSLADSLLVPEGDPLGRPSLGLSGPGTGTPALAAGDGGARLGEAEPVLIPSIETDAPEDEVITDEVRTRYGLLLDRAAERGLLEPADYEVRLRALAEATTTEQMVDIVAELPAFTPPPSRGSPAGALGAGRSIPGPRPGRAAPGRRRMALWALVTLLVIVAVASLVILALSVERLSKNRGSIGPPVPVATRPFSDLRL